jgi:NADH-quinone oxidoreductase subunit F
LGGYGAFKKAFGVMTPAQVRETVTESNLRGRGGAGFPTGVKWAAVPVAAEAVKPKYVVINADEMEPGTFKDRVLLEKSPHLALEGALLTAYAVNADRLYFFIRAEYPLAHTALNQAMSEARRRGYIGENVLGSGRTINCHVHMSIGRYICGEETGLLNALEGKRAHPRSKPPFPQVAGLFGKPTVVNNVETVCNIPGIISFGPAWFKQLGTGKDAGTKLYGVSGRVKNPGIWELPMGATARQIIENKAGGMLDGYKLRGFLPGGASTDFLTTEHLDLPMDFSSVQAAGSRLGTGTMIVLDDKTCPVGMVLNLIRFFARESCGFCTPCRDGLPWTRNILEAIEEGKGEPDDLERLALHCKLLGPGRTFCALAPGAMEPLQSALKYFREDFKRHIKEKKCPYGN